MSLCPEGLGIGAPLSKAHQLGGCPQTRGGTRFAVRVKEAVGRNAK